MLNWIVQVVMIAGIVSPSVKPVLNYAKSLPPTPDQSSITCHDADWELQNLVTNSTIRTSSKLKPFLEHMVSDAQAAEIYITYTSGYRTCGEQASLRAYACGTGDYNMNIKPIKDCQPPTEPAGKSLHNEGLAVDLACSGYSIFQYSPCYTWLRTNHIHYALFEHELEPWHWSTTSK